MWAGYIVFHQAQGGAAWETIFWQVGYCVGHREEFDDGQESGGEPSYLLYLTISVPAAGTHDSRRAGRVRGPGAPRARHAAYRGEPAPQVKCSLTALKWKG